MAFQKGNFPLIPMAPDRYDPDYSAFDNIVQDYQEGLERPRKTELERSARERAERLAALNEALGQRFGARGKEAEISSMESMGELRRLQAEKLKGELEGLRGMRSDTSGPNSVSMREMPKNLQLHYSKQMSDELKKAESGKEAYKILEQMEDLTEKNPDMSEYFAQLIEADKDRSPTLMSRMRRSLVNREDLAAIEKYNKLSNDLVLKAGEGLGAANFTDSKMKALEKAKANARNTSEANLYVINKLKEQFSYADPYADAIRQGLKSNNYVMPNPDYYRQMKHGGERDVSDQSYLNLPQEYPLTAPPSIPEDMTPFTQSAQVPAQGPRQVTAQGVGFSLNDLRRTAEARGMPYNQALNAAAAKLGLSPQELEQILGGANG